MIELEFTFVCPCGWDGCCCHDEELNGSNWLLFCPGPVIFGVVLPGAFGNAVLLVELNTSILFGIGCELILEEENALKSWKEGLLVCWLFEEDIGKALFSWPDDGKPTEPDITLFWVEICSDDVPPPNEVNGSDPRLNWLFDEEDGGGGNIFAVENEERLLSPDVVKEDLIGSFTFDVFMDSNMVAPYLLTGIILELEVSKGEVDDIGVFSLLKDDVEVDCCWEFSTEMLFVSI